MTDGQIPIEIHYCSVQINKLIIKYMTFRTVTLVALITARCISLAPGSVIYVYAAEVCFLLLTPTPLPSFIDSYRNIPSLLKSIIVHVSLSLSSSILLVYSFWSCQNLNPGPHIRCYCIFGLQCRAKVAHI